MITRAALWSLRHRRLVVTAWVGLVVALWQVGGVVGTQKLSAQQLLVGESAQAQAMLDRAGFPIRASEHVLVEARVGSASSPALRRTVARVVAVLNRSGIATDIQSPFGPASVSLISSHRPAVMVDFQISGDSERAATRVQRILAALARMQRAAPGVRIGEFGDASTQYELDRSLHSDFIRAQHLSIPVTLVVLLAAFGALAAATVPVALAFSASTAALGLTAILSRVVPMFGGVSAIVVLIGMAIGVDYSLFYIAREREERSRQPARIAVDCAVRTSGRAITIAGTTVIAALATLLLARNDIFTSVAVAVICVVSIALIGSLTVLPAILSLVGDHLERGRLPARSGRLIGGSRVWPALLDRVLAHPAWSILLGGAVLAALAVPAHSMQLQLPGIGDLPANVPVIATYHRIQAAFPGQLEPAEVVVGAPAQDHHAVTAAIAALRHRALESPLIRPPITTSTNTPQTVTKVSIPLAGDGTNAASNQALDLLRGTLIPETLDRVRGATTAVTGVTADRLDFSHRMLVDTPLIVAAVLTTTFILLLFTFRSIVIPIKAIVLNLLSVAAAYGILVLVFQDGAGAHLIGIHGHQSIVSWVPLFLFVVLFGLSMDYHIFILTRIRELIDSGVPNTDAVATGIKATAGVVTSAASVMVAVFAIFATLQTTNMKQTGVGLAAAILIDATLVRAILLPATMVLLGNRNWYLPTWMHHLPGLRNPD